MDNELAAPMSSKQFEHLELPGGQAQRVASRMNLDVVHREHDWPLPKGQKPEIQGVAAFLNVQDIRSKSAVQL